MASRLTSLLRRRGRADDMLPMTMNDDSDKPSNTLGRRRKPSSLVKYMLAFGGAAFMIFHQLKNKGITIHPSHLHKAFLAGSGASSGIQQSYWKNTKPASSTLKQIYESRNCDAVLNSTRPIYSEADWARFYDIWKENGGRGDPDFQDSTAPPDFVRPTEGGYAGDGKGRGVFASRDIKKGEMVYGHTTNYAYMSSGYSFQKFLEALTDDGEACDLLKFSWPQRGFGPDGESAIICVMDDHSLMNDGGAWQSNYGCLPGKHCGMIDEYAKRDIKKGEEILCNYGGFFSLDFLNYGVWKDFGLL